MSRTFFLSTSTCTEDHFTSLICDFGHFYSLYRLSGATYCIYQQQLNIPVLLLITHKQKIKNENWLSQRYNANIAGQHWLYMVMLCFAYVAQRISTRTLNQCTKPFHQIFAGYQKKNHLLHLFVRATNLYHRWIHTNVHLIRAIFFLLFPSVFCRHQRGPPKKVRCLV